MAQQPIGLFTKLLLYSLTAINIIRTIEKRGALYATVKDSTAFPFNRLGVKEGDVVHFDTRYAMLCDRDEAHLTTLGLIATGNPFTMRCTVAHGIRVIAKERTPMTNLIVVSPDRFDTWANALERSFFTYAQIRSVAGLKVLKDRVACFNNNIILVSSAVYLDLHRLLTTKPIRWARMIVEEHENNPMDKVGFLPADFYLFLMGETGVFPSEWIEHESRIRRFKSIGVERTDYHFPELFYVRNDPEFIKLCNRSTINREMFAEFPPPLVMDLGKIALDGTIAQYHLANHAWREDQDIIAKMRDAVAEETSTSYHITNTVMLLSACLLGKMVTNYRESSRVLEGTISRIVEQRNHTLELTVSARTASYNECIRKHSQLISELHGNYVQNSEALKSVCQTEMDKELRKAIIQPSFLEPKPVPYLVTHISEEIAVSGELIDDARSKLPEHYSMVSGQILGHKVFCPVRENRRVNMAIAIAAGRQVRYGSEEHIAVLCSCVCFDDKTTYESYYASSEKTKPGNKIEVEYMLIDQTSTLTAHHDMLCLIEVDGKIQLDVILAGSMIKL